MSTVTTSISAKPLLVRSSTIFISHFSTYKIQLDKRLTRAEKAKLRQKKALKNRKNRKKAAADPTRYQLRSGWVKKFHCPRAVHSQLSAGELRAASNTWIGVKEPVVERHPTLDELIEDGYTLIPWDGK